MRRPRQLSIAAPDEPVTGHCPKGQCVEIEHAADCRGCPVFTMPERIRAKNAEMIASGRGSATTPSYVERRLGGALGQGKRRKR